MYPHCKKAALKPEIKKAIQEQSTAILEQSVILINNIFYTETFKEDFMYSSKLGWLFSIAVLIVAITVIWVGISQCKANGTVEVFNDNSIYAYIDDVDRIGTLYTSY
jgi:hypothetical protein